MNEEMPLSDRAFLLAWDVTRRRMTGRSYQAARVNAAVVADLWLARLITDEQGKVVAARRPGTAAQRFDPMHAMVLGRITQSAPRSWQYWVMKDAKDTLAAVRDRLEDRLVIRIEQRSLLGISRSQVFVRDEQTARELIQRCREVLLGGQPASQVNRRDAALASLAAAGQLGTVLSGRERRANRKRISELGDRGGPAAAALANAISAQQAMSAG